MLKIGCHLSVSKGYADMGNIAVEIEANTFQFFSRNPRGTSAKRPSKIDADNLRSIAKRNNFAKLLVHAPYTLNACSANAKTRELAYEMIFDDISTLEEYLPNNLYVFHPGSHVGQGTDIGIEFVVRLLNSVLMENQTTMILLETMVGKGSELCGSFEEIKMIIDKVQLRNKVGVCLDTCHLFSAGYDIVNNLDGVLKKFDNLIGLEKIFAVHLNDSLTEFSSKKDRHERIGKGSIGINAIIRIVNHPELRDVPFFLETPNDVSGYAEEIKLIKSVYKEGNSACM